MKKEIGKLEIKQNGAGHVYFVLSSQKRGSVFVSQSFEEREKLQNCIKCLEKLFGKNEDKSVSQYPYFEAFLDVKGLFLIMIHENKTVYYLLSGGNLCEDKIPEAIKDIKDIMKDYVVTDFYGIYE